MPLTGTRPPAGGPPARPWSDATLAKLEQYIAYLRSLGAPGDAHPKVGVNDNYEVTMMICVVKRHATAQEPL